MSLEMKNSLISIHFFISDVKLWTYVSSMVTNRRKILNLSLENISKQFIFLMFHCKLRDKHIAYSFVMHKILSNMRCTAHFEKPTISASSRTLCLFIHTSFCDYSLVIYRDHFSWSTNPTSLFWQIAWPCLKCAITLLLDSARTKTIQMKLFYHIITIIIFLCIGIKQILNNAATSILIIRLYRIINFNQCNCFPWLNKMT